MMIRYGLKEESYKHKIDAEGCPDGIFALRRINLTAGRNDRAAFQVVVDCDEDFDLTVGGHPVFSPRGPLPVISLRCSVEGMDDSRVEIRIIGMIADDDGTMTADPLLTQDSIYTKSGDGRSVWIETLVPADAQPGVYKGKVRIFTGRMFEDEMLTDELDFSISVKDFIMPEPKEYSFYLDLWQHQSNISRKHEVPLWSDRHFEIAEEYVKTLAALGQKAITVIASEIPWSGQNCYRTTDYYSDLFEYSMAKIYRNADGKFEYDFSNMERYIRICMKHGIDAEIEVFGLNGIWMGERPGENYGKVAEDYPDAIRLRYLDRADGKYGYVRTGAGIKAYIRALAAFFTRRRWIDKVRIIADEPTDLEMYKRQTGILKKICPRFKFKAAIFHTEFMENFKDVVDDFVPILTQAAKDWKNILESKKTMRGKLLWYVCCWPARPNTFIRSPLVESRLIGYLTYYFGFDGFLRWNYTVWPENPRERISYRAPGWSAGDMNFVYPGNHGGPILTLRYKLLKRGIEEYEMIKRLYDMKGTRSICRIWDRIIRAPSPEAFEKVAEVEAESLYSLIYEDYEYCRKLLLEGLEKAGKGGSTGA